MERIRIIDLIGFDGKSVEIKGRVINVRKLGNAVTFVLVQDYTGTIQTVWEKEINVKNQDEVKIVGTARKDERAKGGVEVGGESLDVLSTSLEEYPYDISQPNLNLNLTTLLDNRTVTLRHPKVQAIFRLYDILLKSYENVMRAEGFTEVKTPKLLSAASEGGANFFKVEYFEQSAYLAQSPQFYKQIMVGVFERVFEIGPVFRAEPHFTTRHVNEYISLDGEMGFIESFYDITAMITKVLKEIFAKIGEEGAEYLKLYSVENSVVPDKIPHVKLADIKKIIKEKYGYDVPASTDIDPEGERMAGRWAKEEHNSDFVFITHYPWSEKPFYTMPDPENAEETLGFDLIYKGLELITGSQRIHNYDQLIENMEKKGVKPAGMDFYLNTFKQAMPPHGGWGLGSERLIQQLLGLESIKEAVLFPRDVKRLAP